jgi:3-methyladenine DNA glycosylase AlkC
MPAATAPNEKAFKHWFDATRYEWLARELTILEPRFDRRRFLALTLEGLDERELMDRLRQTAVAIEAALPGTYPQKLDTVVALAPRVAHSFVGIALCDFVARFGLGDFERSLDALRQLTRHGSAEFAVRPFLVQDLKRTLAIMRRWAADEDEHVRRLASEGSRPRLPWGLRLGALVRDPSPTAPILEALKNDPSLYVRKSVANHLNDISKDHPEAVLTRLERWDCTKPGTAWVVRHALRTLVKRGQPRALALLGADAGAADQVEVTRFSVARSRLVLGETLELEACFRTKGAGGARLVVDYVIHYVKANRATSAKVFKWRLLTAQPGQIVRLKKTQVIRDFTTRRHHPGRHRVELQINGRRLAETQFTLRR